MDTQRFLYTYLQCSSDTQAETVLTLFKEAVQDMDFLFMSVAVLHGGENAVLSMFMLSYPSCRPGHRRVLGKASTARGWREYQKIYLGHLGSLGSRQWVSRSSRLTLDPAPNV